jgi:hypothetical protein
VDYNRDFSSAEDYRSLDYGEAIETNFDLFDWYRPTESGEYKLIVFYQADELLAQPPAGML